MKKVLILGKGKSGVSAQNLLEKCGYYCDLVDDSTDVYEERVLSSFCFAITSPGVPPFSKWVSACKKAGLQIVSELDLGLFLLKTKNVVAITGTNGKTTCTRLVELLLSCKSKTFALGNIGIPLSSEVQNINPCDNVVLEVSSFMLAQSQLLCPYVAVLTNITPDHKEWHGSMEHYKNSKLKIFQNQKPNCHAILDADDESFCELNEHVKCNLWQISTKRKVKGCFVLRKNIIFSDGHINRKVASVRDIKIVGNHNLKNVLMCVLVAKIFGVKSCDIKKTLRNFYGMPHRVKVVGKHKGILFVDDSKSTNGDSTIVAVKSFENKNITLLLGGYDKGIDCTQMFEELATKVKNIVVFGACKEKFLQQAKSVNLNNVFVAKDLSCAFATAIEISKKGEVVLLSPATSSFDEFQNYAERGDKFVQLVKDFENNGAKTKKHKTL